VDLDSLFIYKQYLQATMDGELLKAEYREEGGVGREPVWFCGVSDEVDPSSGLLCSIFGEFVHGEFPLSEVTINLDSSNRQLVEDYKYWFRQGQMV
jgi:hypothetical protein